ncbi:MAG: hypothetical protein HUU57_09725 [Bdellovibrio sp.]|nr:hypothetical protein [Bdellovibrio sp.]
MIKNTLLALALTAVFSANASAQTETKSESTSATNESSVKVSDMQKPTEKVKDIDDEITDARMRATLGSKSMWSFKSSLAYNGGSLKDPGATVRPAYRTGPDTEALATLSGNVGVNLRLNERDNLSFGTGITIVDPFHGDITKNAEDKTYYGNGKEVARYRVSTPYMGWSRGYKAFGAQMISSMTGSYYTADTTTALGYSYNLSYSQTILANFGTTKWNGGVSFSLSKDFYGNEVTNKGFKADMNSGKVNREEWLVGAYPFMQYSFTDRYSFRTVFGYGEFQRKEDTTGFKQVEPYQSVGLGISVTRDIYLYPNIQFTPKDIRDDRTNVALSTNINLF